MTSKIVASLLLVGLLLVTINAQSSALKKIDQSDFGRNLLDTIDIQISSGQAVQSLLGLLRDLSDSLHNEQAEHDSRHGDYVADCTSDLAELDGQISETENSFNDAVAHITEANNQLEDTVSQLSSFNDQLEAEQTFLDSITAQRETEHDVFLERSSEHEAAIEAVQEAGAKVGTLYSAQSTSFLESPAKSTHKQILAQVSASLKKTGKVAGYTPIIKFIGQVADIDTNPDFGFPRESVAKLQGLITRLTQLLRDSYEDILRNEQSAATAFEAIRTDVNAKINELEGKIAELQAQQQALEDDIARWTVTRDNLETALAAYKEERQDRQDQCDEETANYNSETARRGDELTIVGQVTSIVENKLSNMRDYLAARVQDRYDASESASSS